MVNCLNNMLKCSNRCKINGKMYILFLRFNCSVSVQILCRIKQYFSRVILTHFNTFAECSVTTRYVKCNTMYLYVFKGNCQFGLPGPYFSISFQLNESYFQFVQLFLSRVRDHQSFRISTPSSWSPCIRMGTTKKVQTLVDPHSRQDQLQKLKMPPFIQIKADEKIRSRLFKMGVPL